MYWVGGASRPGMSISAKALPCSSVSSSGLYITRNASWVVVLTIMALASWLPIGRAASGRGGRNGSMSASPLELVAQLAPQVVDQVAPQALQVQRGRRRGGVLVPVRRGRHRAGGRRGRGGRTGGWGRGGRRPRPGPGGAAGPAPRPATRVAATPSRPLHRPGPALLRDAPGVAAAGPVAPGTQQGQDVRGLVGQQREATLLSRAV